MATLEIDSSKHLGLTVSPELISKYSVAGPRYTSYPTAVELKDNFQSSKWVGLLQAETSSEEEGAYSLYFHLPFCPSLCYFCACNKIITQDTSNFIPYLTALKKELKTYRELLGGEIPIEQIHWGGGTPNYLSPEQMIELHQATLESFDQLVDGADVSIEIDPRTITLQHLRTLSDLGFNRLSFGVQDFDPKVQEAVNRIQPYEMTREVTSMARDNGFSNINVDLIYGLPEQTLVGFSKTVDKIIEIRPERIALYGYAHVTWIKKVQKSFERLHLPTPAERIAIFIQAINKLTSAGYIHIGMDHFALPEDGLTIALKNGRLNRNFMGYTAHKGAKILGFGVSAISSLRSGFVQNTKDLVEYQKRISTKGIAIDRGLVRTEDDLLRGDIIEGLLCQGVIEVDKFEQLWGKSFSGIMADAVDELEKFSQDDLLCFEANQIRLTETGRLFARNIAMTFDAYLKKHLEVTKQVFSQAV